MMMEFELNCPEIFDPLARIDAAVQIIKDQLPGSPGTELGEFEGWQYKRIGKIVAYTRDITLTGSAQAVNLPFSKGIELMRIDQYPYKTGGSPSARSYNTRMHAMINPDAYADLDTQTLITAVRSVYFCDKYPTANTLTINFTASTADDNVQIQILVEELE